MDATAGCCLTGNGVAQSAASLGRLPYSFYQKLAIAAASPQGNPSSPLRSLNGSEKMPGRKLAKKGLKAVRKPAGIMKAPKGPGEPEPKLTRFFERQRQAARAADVERTFRDMTPDDKKKIENLLKVVDENLAARQEAERIAAYYGLSLGELERLFQR